MIGRDHSISWGTIADIIEVLDLKTLKVIEVTKEDLIDLTKIADYSEKVTFIDL